MMERRESSSLLKETCTPTVYQVLSSPTQQNSPTAFKCRNLFKPDLGRPTMAKEAVSKPRSCRDHMMYPAFKAASIVEIHR